MERTQEWDRRIKEWEPFANPVGLIRLILLVAWDPLRVFGNPYSMDEYDDYANKVYALLASEAPQEELIAYLRAFDPEGKRARLEWEVDLQTVAAKLRYTFDTCRDYG